MTQEQGDLITLDMGNPPRHWRGTRVWLETDIHGGCRTHPPIRLPPRATLHIRYGGQFVAALVERGGIAVDPVTFLLTRVEPDGPE